MRQWGGQEGGQPYTAMRGPGGGGSLVRQWGGQEGGGALCGNEGVCSSDQGLL